jgi:hypothetical protein
MFRGIATFAALIGVALTGGCADLMQQSYISQIAPEWFEAKAVEVKGEGYPELADIPEARPVEGNAAQWERRASAVKDEAARMEAKLQADGPITPDATLRATAAQWRATLEDGAAAAGHPVTPPAPLTPPAPTP